MSPGQQVQESSYETISDKFFDLLKEGKTSDAVDYMFATNPALAKNDGRWRAVEVAICFGGNADGPYVSHTKLLETKVAEMFVYQQYRLSATANFDTDQVLRAGRNVAVLWPAVLCQT
jgi:hypothetical protein